MISRLKLLLRGQYWQRVQPKKTVLKCHWGDFKAPRYKKLCLFSTYDPQGQIDPYVKHYLKAISACGFDIIVVATSPSIADSDISELAPYCRAVILRKNIGIDFGSWKVATQICPDWKDYDRLLLANDSVYGPFSDLARVFEQMEQQPEQVLGLTDNLEIAYHLQSYFLYFKRPILESKAFLQFWDSIKLYLDKYYIIDKFEVGLSRYLITKGFKIKAIYPYSAVRDFTITLGDSYKFHDKVLSDSMNQTLYMWDILLTQFKFPFLKTEILKINRFDFPQIANWRRLIPDEAAVGRSLIENHLKRLFPDAAGLKSE